MAETSFHSFYYNRGSYTDAAQKYMMVKAIRKLADRIEQLDVEFFHDDAIGECLEGVSIDIMNLESDDFFGTEGMKL